MKNTKKKNGKITKHPGGRPTKMSEDTVKKLESIFKIGGTVEEAVSYASITKPTYYGWIKQDDSFLTKMEAAKHYATVAAKNVVVEAITKDKDLNTAKWWLEKKHPEEFGGQSQSSQMQINVFNNAKKNMNSFIEGEVV